MLGAFFNRPRSLKSDILAGLTTVLTLIPEAVAFTFVAGIDPMIGLYGSFFIALITAAFGGRPAMISGAAGSMAVVTTAFIIMFGIEYLFAAVILTGILQVLFGAFKLGKFIRLLPHPVMLGFVNGLAIVIGWAQFTQFKENTRVVYDSKNEFFTYASDWMSLTDPRMLTMIGMIVLTMAIIHFLPKVNKSLPAPLVAIVVCTLLALFTPLGQHTKTVKDVVKGQRVSLAEKKIKTAEFDAIKDTVPYGQVTETANKIAARPIAEDQLGTPEEVAKINEGLVAKVPSFHIPQINWSDFNGLKTIFILAFILASIGLIETLMTLSLIDELTETKGSGNQESIAQGAGNMVSGFFGGMCGCAMIGQSIINLNSGGRGRTSGIATAFFLLGFIFFAPSVIEMIPVAALIGVMFIVVIETFEWSSLRLFGKVPKAEIFIIITVSTVTVLIDLAIAVGIGIIISALVYAWHNAQRVSLEISDEQDDQRTYKVEGAIFFGSITSFKELFSPKEDPNDVYLDFENARVVDHSAIEAIHGLSEKYKALGKKLHLVHLSKDCAAILSKAGDIVEVNVVEDPKYFAATNS